MASAPVTINVISLSDGKFVSSYKLVFNKTDKSSSSTRIGSIPVLQVDSLVDLQKKISLYTGIEYYKQCLCTLDFVPVTHKALLYDTSIDINLAHILGNDNVVSNINMDLLFYENKNDLTIVDTASFTFMNNLETLEFNLVSMDLFITEQLENVRVETYQELYYYGCVLKYWPMFSFTAFITYITTPLEFSSAFPLLNVSKEELQFIYTQDYDLYKNIPVHKVNLYNYIESHNLSLQIQSVVIENKTNTGVCNLRIVFDMLELNSNQYLSFVYLQTEFNGRQLHLLKIRDIYTSQYILENEDIIENIIKQQPYETNLLYLVYKLDTMYIILKMYDTGTYELICKIYNNATYTINEILSISSKHTLPQMKYVQTIYPDMFLDTTSLIVKYLSVILVWNKNINIDLYNMIPTYMDPFMAINVVKNVSDEKKHYFDFLFYKGIKGNDQILFKNGFDYLTDLKANTTWNKMVNTGQHVSIKYLFNQVQFELINVTNDNFNVIYSFVRYLSCDFIVKYKNTVLSIDSVLSLKSLDPVLYTLQGDKLYSRICQKKYQPKMLLSLTDIPESEKAKYTRYYNFTTKTPVYYTCPNKLYSHFGFITNIHPSNYCIPCCKKKGKHNHEIHKQCLQNHVYVETADVSIKSRYISNFGKAIEHKRLSQLPPLLYTYFTEYKRTILDIFVDNTFTYNDITYNVLDILRKNKVQHVSTKTFEHILFEKVTENESLHSILSSPSLNQYVFKTITSIILKPLIVYKQKENYTLLWNKYVYAKYWYNGFDEIPVVFINGQLGGAYVHNDGFYLYGNQQYFNNMNTSLMYCLAMARHVSIEDLIIDIVKHLKQSTTLANRLSSKYKINIIEEFSSIYEYHSTIPWNKLIIEIAYYVYQIYICIFYIKNDNLHLKTLSKNNKNYSLLMVFKKVDEYKTFLQTSNYYLIAYCVLKTYFKTQDVHKVLFNTSDEIYHIVDKLLSHVSLGNEKHFFIEFIYSTNSTILQYYVNNNDNIYACLIEWQTHKLIFPIYFAFNKLDDINMAGHQTYSRKQSNIPVDKLIQYLNLFNEFLVIHNMVKLQFVVQRYIMYKNTYIGLVANNLYFYFSPCKEVPLVATNGNVLSLRYDPDELNAIIADKKQENKNITRNLMTYYYKNYLYYLFCLQIVFNVNLSKIKSEKDFAKYFQIEKNITLNTFPNVMLSCLSGMPYCLKNKLFISQSDYNNYSKLFLHELQTNKFYKNKLLSYMLNNFFKFSKYNNENIYIQFIDT